MISAKRWRRGTDLLQHPEATPRSGLELSSVPEPFNVTRSRDNQVQSVKSNSSCSIIWVERQPRCAWNRNVKEQDLLIWRKHSKVQFLSPASLHCACMASWNHVYKLPFNSDNPAWPERKSACMTSDSVVVKGWGEKSKEKQKEEMSLRTVKLVSNQMRLKNRSGNQQQRQRARFMQHANTLTKSSLINTTYNLHILQLLCQR